MLHIRNQEDAKKTSRALVKALNAVGLDLQHGQGLDTLARMSGFKDYNSLSASFSAEAIDERLMVIEREHAEDNASNRYGKECALVMHTDFELRYAAEGELLDYVRVCDPLGREIAYWTYEEWRDDPQLVMGAILGALARGEPVDLDNGKQVHTDSRASEALREQSPVLPRIQDIDFMRAYAVVVNDSGYDIAWREEIVLACLDQPASEDFEDHAEDNALLLTFNADGFVNEVWLSLALLASLIWSPERKAFVCPRGDVYKFFFSVDTETYLSQLAGKR